ncbi:glycosyltransferase [Microbacterium kitamiense]|uniref:Glycosyltransferase n=2 Tax=Microbacterium aurantiacum TaxID=162393 RepID=A0AAJ2HHJ8_9MICO|nr:glycosyltransferase [Microbacterium aurantiacum]
MATYNGAAYVKEQLESILADIDENDEVVIVDDASTDSTLTVIESIGDSRIRLLRQPANRGYVRTFEQAMLEARGQVLLLADQDDVWVEGRTKVLARAVQVNGVAASNLRLLDSGAPLRSPLSGRPWVLRKADSHRRLRNEIKILMGDMPYFGCAMGVTRDVLARVTPFPSFLTESHDLWIATVANRHGLMSHVEDFTIERRVHDSNASTPRPRGIRKVLRARWMLVRAYIEAGSR